jgi:hypothetical protein
MSDAQLEGKFHGLSDPVLGAQATSRLIAACWELAAAKDARVLAALAVPA